MAPSYLWIKDLQKNKTLNFCLNGSRNVPEKLKLKACIQKSTISLQVKVGKSMNKFHKSKMSKRVNFQVSKLSKSTTKNILNSDMTAKKKRNHPKADLFHQTKQSPDHQNPNLRKIIIFQAKNHLLSYSQTHKSSKRQKNLQKNFQAVLL